MFHSVLYLYSTLLRQEKSLDVRTYIVVFLSLFLTSCTPEQEKPTEFENIPPYSPIVSLSPLAPKTQDTITATLIFDTTDPDGDPASLAYMWKKDGIEQTINGDTVLHTQTQKGEVWTLEAYTFDGSLKSSTISVSTTIRNTPPSVTHVETTTTTPNAKSSISIEDIQAQDVDDDSISIEIHWYLDGDYHPEFQNDHIIPAEQTIKDQVWEAWIIPHDGDDAGEEYIQSFTIQNTAPEITNVHISPQEAFEDSILSAQIDAIDEDLDELSYTLSWKINGVSIATSETLSGALFDKGDVVTLTAEAFDGHSTSSPVSSPPITIQNTAPTVSSMSIEPQNPYTTNDLTCSVIVEEDVDQDQITVSYEWFINNQPSLSSGNILEHSLFEKGDIIRCEAHASDQSAQTVFEWETTIQNTSPIVQDVTLTSPASMMDILYCEPISSDDDNDFIIHQYEWFIFGSLITHTNSFLNPQNSMLGILPGDEISCSATPTDGEDTGNTISSNTTTLLPAYITLDGTIILNETPVSGVIMSSNTLSVGEDVSSPTDGSYELSIPTLSGSIIYADIDNDVSPQSFSLDINDGTSQTQDIVLLDTHFPTQTDIFDPDNGYVDFNNFASTMQHSDIASNQALQYRTLYPAGEEDWIRVSLSAQETYSFFTTFAHHTSSTVMFIYDAQGTQVGNSTPYLGNDNIIETFSPSQTGDYYIKIDTVEMNDVASYLLGVQDHEDQDSDGHIAWYDCDDNNPDIHPNAIEITLDGIDQNCDGEDHIAATSLDSTEALGVQYLAPITHQQTHPENPLYTDNTVYTLHSSADLDRFSLSIPSKSKYELVIQLSTESTVRVDIIDGNILVDTFTSQEDIILYNTSSISKEFYVYVRNTITGTPTHYQIKSIGYGTDNDLDGYYSNDINGLRDDDDANPGVHP
ncbi:MAG: hypothetical protein CL916_13440 [Deltaproteobacteria bacterium]|nr:hypothetical protein [Deltaproteobacteria bacterium]